MKLSKIFFSNRLVKASKYLFSAQKLSYVKGKDFPNPI